MPCDPSIRHFSILPDASHDYCAVREGLLVKRIGPKCDKGSRGIFSAHHHLDVVTTHENFVTWLLQKPYEHNESDELLLPNS